MVVIYKTEHCPMCQMLQNKLNEKNIEYKTISDPEILKKKKITFVPVLETQEKMLGLAEALKWIGEQI